MHNAQTAHVFSSRSVNPFPQIVDGAVSSHQQPTTSLTAFGRFKRTLWLLTTRLSEPNTRFGIKTGLGAALLAAPAFITPLRPLWLAWRGEWALISYVVVMQPSQGQTNFLALGRILGTLAGAGAAIVAYTLFPENAVILPIIGALVSAPCFYVIITRVSLRDGLRALKSDLGFR